MLDRSCSLLRSWCPPISFGGHHRFCLRHSHHGWDDRAHKSSHPEMIAITDGDTQCSYGQLRELVNALHATCCPKTGVRATALSCRCPTRRTPLRPTFLTGVHTEPRNEASVPSDLTGRRPGHPAPHLQPQICGSASAHGSRGTAHYSRPLSGCSVKGFTREAIAGVSREAYWLMFDPPEIVAVEIKPLRSTSEDTLALDVLVRTNG